VIVKKLKLAELTLELGRITRKKWDGLQAMKEILKREEELIKEIADKTHELDK
jgi:hypothetical protein